MGGLVQRGGAHRRLKDDTYLLISVGGGYTTGHSFPTGYSTTADYYTAKRGEWYSGR